MCYLQKSLLASLFGLPVPGSHFPSLIKSSSIPTTSIARHRLREHIDLLSRDLLVVQQWRQLRRRGIFWSSWSRADRFKIFWSSFVDPRSTRISFPSARFFRGGERSARNKWPEVVGLTGEEAKKIIEEENPGLELQIVDPFHSVIMNFRTDRVRIFVDSEGEVIRTPTVG